MAAASDIARLITPLLVRGTYSDFDTTIEVESLPDTMDINGPLILNIGSLIQSIDPSTLIEIPLINNDIIALRNITNDDFPEEFTIEEQTLIKITWLNNTKLNYKIVIDEITGINQTIKTRLSTSYHMIKDIEDPDECFRLMQLSLSIQSTRYKDMSFDANHLFDHFHSGQSFHLGSPKQAFEAIADLEVGKFCDMSWLPQGQTFVRKREFKLHDAAVTIQTMWRRHQKHQEAPPLDEHSGPKTP